MPRCMLGVWCLFELCICCPYLALHTPCDSSIGIANCEPPDHQLNPVILHALPKRLFLWWLRFAKASCVSQILTAQAVASDMGGELAATTGVRSWAACNVKNSERDAHRTIEKQKSKLELKISTIRCSSLQMPWISPEAWFSFLVRKGLWPVLAGCDRFDYSGASRNWTEFWGTYQELFPGFEVFNVQGLDLSRTAAIFLHGDEGRTLKRGGMMITSLQSALGRGYDEKRVKGQTGNKLRVNFAGHSFTTRFIVSTMPKTCYESDPEVFQCTLDHIAKSLCKLLEVGVLDPSTNQTFKVALIGIKGDAPYLVKAGSFYRSYNTTAKRGEERGPPKGVCPYCLAGTNGFPAEDISTAEPRWLSAVGVKLPWIRTPPMIKRCLHDRGDPASFFKSDIWHVVHLGFGRSWIASTIQVLLPYLLFPNLDEKWNFLTSNYLHWCSDNKRQAHIAKITPYLMSYGDNSGAMGNWHKGALTSNFMKWLVHLLGEPEAPRDPEGLILQCLIATNRLNAMFSFLYRGGAFITEEECQFVSEQGLGFLKTYASLAQTMFDRSKQWCFPLYPKLHVFHHLMIEIRSNGCVFKKSCNPLMWSCQLDEDTVGRASRLSRRVNVRKVSFRTLDRYLVAANTAFVKAKWLS